MALIDDLAASLKELTDDMEAEIIDRHGSNPQFYEYSRRKFDRDMATVRAARKLLAEHEAAGGNTNGKMPADQAQKIASKSFPDYRNGLPIPGEWRDAPPAGFKPGSVTYADVTQPKSSPQLDALLCELGALGVRLDVLRGQ